jgi:hypothetical protein
MLSRQEKSTTVATVVHAVIDVSDSTDILDRLCRKVWLSFFLNPINCSDGLCIKFPYDVHLVSCNPPRDVWPSEFGEMPDGTTKFSKSINN